MTNAEKFEEVFGIKIDENYPKDICQSIDHTICEEHNCPDCPAFKFWDQEYEENKECDPKTGYWVEENINGGRKVFCSECGCPPPFEHVSTGDVYSSSGYGVINKTKFCPGCGTRMIESKEKKL